MAGAKHDKTYFESDDYDDAKNNLKDSDVDDDDEEEEIVPDTRQTLVEPSPVFLPDLYDSDHLHRHHRRDESVLNIRNSVINSSPVQVSNCMIIVPTLF